jgi:phosphopantetheine adenylyltransferase
MDTITKQESTNVVVSRETSNAKTKIPCSKRKTKGNPVIDPVKTMALTTYEDGL